MKMNLKQKAIINSVGSLVVFFAQWLISVLIVRVSGYTEAGIFSLAMSISNVFSFFTNYNIRNYQISDIRNEYTQVQYLYARIFTALISMATCVIYLMYAKGYNAMTKYAIFIYLLYSNINMVSDIMLGSLQLHNRLEINGYSNMLRGIICFMGFMMPHLVKKDLLLSLWSMVIGDLAFTFMYDGRIYRQIEGKLKFLDRNDFYAIGKVLKKCFLLMLSGILPIVTTAIPRRYIQLIHGEEALGFFSSIFTPTVLITTLAPALILAAIPGITDYWEKNQKRELYKTVWGCYLGCLLVIIVADLIALICGKQVIKLIYGEQIMEYYDLLYWAIAVTGVNAMTSCGNAVLIPMRKSRIVAFAALASAVFVLLISNFLIERYYIYGAAYALLCGYAIHTLIQICVIFIKIGKQKG